ncbi:hypothetical protein CLAIMM_01960 [Cladophialophora immunda]|nr:hypothetical protein CLAIMM_01960 [Cladophialophora immunda]
MVAPKYRYTDIVFTIQDRIGVIKFNRPRSLNSFGGNMMMDLATALRELNEHPDTVFTVITGEGRFFSSGADILGKTGLHNDIHGDNVEYPSLAAKKIAMMAKMSFANELLRSMIDHRKVLVLALNGPAIGGGATWFPGVADIVLAADSVYLQTPFSALGLVPELGSATIFMQTMGVHRANDFLMLGRKLSVQELEQWGVVNRIFPKEGFHDRVLEFLRQQLAVNDGKSMMEAKRLQNLPLRRDRILAVYDALEALAERHVEDAPKQRFADKQKLLREKSKARSKL